MTSVKMPQLGETVVEGTILKWLKAEGETVELDEPLFEISTDKVDTEVPSVASGVVKKILVPEGTTVSVGTELAVIEGDAEGDAGAGAPEPASRPAVLPTAVAPAGGATDGGSEGSSAPTPAPPAVATTAPLQDRGPRSQILSPLVRRLAAERGVDLSTVVGTGTGGRITKKDVLAAAAGPAPAAAPPAAVPPAVSVAVAPPVPAAAAGGEEIVPVPRVRGLIAEHMKRSLEVSARAWNAVEVNMENVARLRERLKEAFKAREGFSLTYMPFVTRAVTEALVAFPMVNSELRGDQIVVKHYVNMGIAVSYDEGLIVPVLKGADTMNLLGIARGINDLATRARAKALQPDEIHGGTFTITNPGPFGSLISVPIINQPESAILAFDTVEKRPVVIDDAIAIRHMVYLSLSWDHRLIDGALASQFLSRVKQNLETWDFAEDLAL
jgi:2-oxoglutarate dehydrogenase E2 component (dihydrolipoamide succinyltransferase)